MQKDDKDQLYALDTNAAMLDPVFCFGRTKADAIATLLDGLRFIAKVQILGNGAFDYGPSEPQRE